MGHVKSCNDCVVLKKHNTLIEDVGAITRHFHDAKVDRSY